MKLVVGATGMLGTEICRLLRAREEPVRALVRATADPVKVDALRALGAEIVTGDLRDPASLQRACLGASCVLSTATAIGSFSPENTFLSADGGTKDLIDAAQAAGAAHFVFVSVTRGLNPDCDLIRVKRINEQHLVQSGLSYTILRPSAFMEVWLSPRLGFDAANARANVIGHGDARLSYISYLDVAQFAVAAIGHPGAHNAAIELGGPDAVSPLEVVHIFEKLSGRTFQVVHIPVEALQAQHAAAANPLEKTFAALMMETAKGDVIPMQDVLRSFPDITLRSVEDYARQSIPIPAV
jgi:NADH dehydrogenase